MRVRTIRDHYNSHGESYFKSGGAGPVYDVSDSEGRRLISRGYVESADGEDIAGGVSRVGQGAGRVAQGDSKKRASASGKGRAGANGKRSVIKGAAKNG